MKSSHTHPGCGGPLIISVALASGLMIFYYSWVDFPWLVEETIPPDAR